MDKHGLVPDVVAVLPKEILQVEYGAVQVQEGNELSPTQVKDKPTRLTWTTKPDTFYTLILSDPDIPPQFNFKQCQHWLVVNIPGNDLSKGDTVFEYFGSGPPQGSGIHRYIFLVFKQSNRLEKSCYSDITDDALADRGKFLVKNLVEKLQLEAPVAGNLFRAQFDDYVPTMHQKLAEKYGPKNE